MAMINGFRVSEIVTGTNEYGLGYVVHTQPTDPNSEERIRLILVAAAGAAADYLHWKRERDRLGASSTSDELSAGHISDQHEARKHLDELGDPGSFWDYVAVAIAVLQEPDTWRIVEMFGELMQQIPKLDGQEVFERAFNKIPKLTSAELHYWRTNLVLKRPAFE